MAIENHSGPDKKLRWMGFGLSPPENFAKDCEMGRFRGSGQVLTLRRRDFVAFAHMFPHDRCPGEFLRESCFNTGVLESSWVYGLLRQAVKRERERERECPWFGETCRLTALVSRTDSSLEHAHLGGPFGGPCAVEGRKEV